MLNNIVLWEFLNIAIAVMEIGIYCFIINKVNVLKRSKLYKNISTFILLVIIFILMIFNIHQDIRLILMVIFSIIYYKDNYEVSIPKSIIYTLLYFIFLMLNEIIGTSFTILINSIENPSILVDPNVYRLEAVILSKPILIIVAINILKLKKLFNEIIIKRVKIYLSKKIIYIIIPILINIFCLLVIFAGMEYYKHEKVDNIVMVFSVILLFLSNISLLLVTSKIIKDNKIKIESELVDNKKDMEHKYYEKLEDNNEKVRKLYHDMKNHLMCIGSLCDNDESIDYINNLNKELVGLDRTFNTGNRVLDIILSEKKTTCLEKGIKLTTEIDFSRSDFMDMLDISAIFSNSIDNAIQACDKINDNSIPKKINIRVKYVNNFCVIKIINSKVNEIIKKKDKILTDKKDGFMHGLGISNIKDAVQKYNGDVVIDYTENEFVLTAMIPTN